MFEERITKLFNEYKCIYPYDEFRSLPVYNEDGELIAFLKPIIKEYRKVMPEIITLLGQWRKENPTLSTAQFEISNERTEKWLDNLIIGRNDRLLFMIDGLDGRHLGHIGYSNCIYEQEAAEVDSVLRGIKDVYPGLMTFALNSLLRWGILQAKLKRILLEVTGDNVHAIEFYHRYGFKITKTIPLIKEVFPDEIRWNPAPSDYDGASERHALIMDIDIYRILSGIQR